MFVAFGRLTDLTLGYTPGRALGLGPEDEPGGVLTEWYRWNCAQCWGPAARRSAHWYRSSSSARLMGASMLPEPSTPRQCAPGRLGALASTHAAAPGFAVVRTARRGPRPERTGAGGYGRMGPWRSSAIAPPLRPIRQPAPPAALRGFPFRCELSLAPLITFWTQTSAYSEFGRGPLPGIVREKVKHAPELTRVIEDLSVIAQHKALVDLMMTAMFPPAFWEQEYGAALFPFQLRAFYATSAFRRSLMNDDGTLQGRVNLDPQRLGDVKTLLAYELILQRTYGIGLGIEAPVIFTTVGPRHEAGPALPDAVRLALRRDRAQRSGAPAGRGRPATAPGRPHRPRSPPRRLAAGGVRPARFRDHEGGRRHRPGGPLLAQAGPHRQGIHRVERPLPEPAGEAADLVPAAGAEPGPRRGGGRPGARPQRRLEPRARVHLRGFRAPQDVGVRGVALRAGGPRGAARHHRRPRGLARTGRGSRTT